MRFVFLIILSLFFSNLTFAATPESESSPDLKQMSPEEIQSLRKGMGLTQPEFVKILRLTLSIDVSTSSVSGWETGAQKPSPQALEALHQFKKYASRHPLKFFTPSEIRTIRVDVLEMTHAEFAKVVSSYPQLVASWESGKSKPNRKSLKALRKLAKLPRPEPLDGLVEFSPAEIKALREGLGMSQAEFAKEVWSSAKFVARWEDGNGKPRSDSLEAMHELKIQMEMPPSKIQSIRKKLGLTQAEFADKLWAYESSVSAWESGTAKPHGNHLERLSRLEKQGSQLVEFSPAEIRALRKQLRLNQSEFGEKFQVRQTAVSQWEKGKSKPNRQSLETLHQLKKEAGLPESRIDLLTGAICKKVNDRSIDLEIP